MPRACSAGLVEDGQRTASECKRALQDRQVLIYPKPDVSVDILLDRLLPPPDICVK